MFDRSLLKSNAKQALKRFYGLALVALLIYAGITGIGSRIGASGTNSGAAAIDPQEISSEVTEALQDPNANPGDIIDIINDAMNEVAQNEQMQEITPAAAATASGASLLAILFFLFVSTQLEVGLSRFFLNARENKANLGNLFWSYKHNFGTTMGTIFCRDLYIALWSLLLVFPGIIKYYEYSMVPYLLAENPGMTHHRAFKLSKAMTKGYKGKLFALDLSFIGWYALGLLCCCMGGFFVIPYHLSSWAEAYTFLKARAIESGKAEAYEFQGFQN